LLEVRVYYKPFILPPLLKITWVWLPGAASFNFIPTKNNFRAIHDSKFSDVPDNRIALLTDALMVYLTTLSVSEASNGKLRIIMNSEGRGRKRSRPESVWDRRKPINQDSR
jgi:hypothetical protein